MMVCPYHPHIEAIGSQLNMPKGVFKGLYIFVILEKLGNLMYLALKYM